jgi:hypothetical protein
MRDFENRFAPAVDAFIASYPAYVARMRPALNGLFRNEDYEDPETVRSKFGLKLEVLPIPSGDDFRVKLSEEQRAQLAREIDQNVRESLARVARDLWLRLHRVVVHMVDVLSNPQVRLHASVVDNVIELADLLPRLNVNGNPQLDAFAEEVRNRLCHCSSHELRKNEELRMETAREAAGIADRISAVISSREESELSPESSFTAKQVEQVFDRMSTYLGGPGA